MNARLKSGFMIGGMVLSWSIYYTVSKLLVDMTGSAALSGMLLRKSDQVALNPMDYVRKTVVAYKNPGHNYVSPYTTSAYSGMMFNSYC